MTSAATKFAVVSAVRSAAHQLADFWIQRPQHAVDKGQPGAAGAVPCALHVLTYSLTSAAAVAVANRVFGLGVSVRGMVLGELVSALTHYTADRREHGLLFPLALDQAWHHTANALASAVTALNQAGGR
jgi:hypothetical protein